MQYLVDFINTASDTEINQYLSDNGCTVLKEWDNFDKCFLVECAAPPASSSITERVIEETHLALIPQTVIPVDPKSWCHSNPKYPKIEVDITDPKQWWKNFSYIQPKFENGPLELSRLGAGVDVYIMDSGIRETHTDFVNAQIIKLYSVTGTDFVDRNGHGTAMAGVIVGQTCGITNATIKVVKIFDPNHSTLQSEFLDALDAIINDHTENTFGIINASWSIPKNEFIEHKLRLAIAEGIFVVCASGNDGGPIEDVTPASMYEVMTIGAYNQNLEPCNFSDYTGQITTTQNIVNHGELDGWAPGEDIWVPSIGSDIDFENVSGTSIAAAIAVACLASNLTWWMNDDGSRQLYAEDLIVSTLSLDTNHSVYPIFGRVDLLDLSDPKYANSKNILATLWDQCVKVWPDPPDELNKIWYIGIEAQKVIFSQATTKEITLLTPLPDNFQIQANGKIWGKPSAAQGPREGEHYGKYEFKFLRKDYNDNQEEVTLNIYIMDINKDISTIPEDDPVIPITLQLTCGGNGCGTAASWRICYNDCTSVGGCCANTKTFDTSCKCDPG